MLIVIHANKGGKCLAVTSSASKKKNTTKRRGGRGGHVTMISLLFPAEADKSTLTHLGVAQMANSKLKLVSLILIQNILSFYAETTP